MIPFSGFRLFRLFQVSLRSPHTESYLVLTKCERGKILYSKSVEVTSKTEIDFTKVICLEELSSCFKIARRRRYAFLNLIYFVPNTFVGALFECDENCTALMPLIADDFSKHWLSGLLTSSSVRHNVPYLRTPSRLDPRFLGASSPINFTRPWWKGIDPDERYSYSEHEMYGVKLALASSGHLLRSLQQATSTVFKDKVKLLFGSLRNKAMRHVTELQLIVDQIFTNVAVQ